MRETGRESLGTSIPAVSNTGTVLVLLSGIRNHVVSPREHPADISVPGSYDLIYLTDLMKPHVSVTATPSRKAFPSRPLPAQVCTCNVNIEPRWYQ